MEQWQTSKSANERPVIWSNWYQIRRGLVKEQTDEQMKDQCEMNRPMTAQIEMVKPMRDHVLVHLVPVGVGGSGSRSKLLLCEP